MASSSIRIPDDTLVTLRELSEEEHKSIGQIVAAAVKHYQDNRFWETASEGYIRLRSNPEEWKAWQEETAIWDTTSSDGLEDEPPYPDR